jgi:hypothetical protein
MFAEPGDLGRPDGQEHRVLAQLARVLQVQGLLGQGLLSLFYSNVKLQLHFFPNEWFNSFARFKSSPVSKYLY